MSVKPWGLIVDVELHWGLSLNYFSGTKSRPALRVVPPTTLIGALAYPLARLEKWPEDTKGASTADRLRGLLLGVYYSILEGLLVPYAEVTKIQLYKVRERQVITDAVGIQRLYAPMRTMFRLYYVFNPERAGRALGEEWRELLEGAAWGITRLGARESIVSVRDVEPVDVEVVEVDAVETSATIPLDSAESVKGSYVVAEVVDWRRTSIGRYHGAPTTRVAQPSSVLGQPSRVEVKLRGAKAYRVGGEHLVPWIA